MDIFSLRNIHVLKFDQRTDDALKKVSMWAKNYLVLPHNDLGRSGPVCPFVKNAVDSHNALFFSVESISSGCEFEKLENVILQRLVQYRNLSVDSQAENYKALMILFPELEDCAETSLLIDKIHKKLKPIFVRDYLMLGQFYPSCNESGLHNPDFRPLTSPIPLFVIREMQVLDLPFLAHDVEFIRSYCNKFGINDRSSLDKLVASMKLPKLPNKWEYYSERVFSMWHRKAF